jgi:signal peptidase I
MEPNLYDHEYLIINEISYFVGSPQRGDIVVFKYPLDPSQYFIKRVISLPGEKIRITDGKVYIFNNQHPDGQVLEEDYLLPAMKTLGEVTVELGSGEYYLLGDNRIHSLDSRFFGPVSRQFIIGKTLVRGWPPSRAGLLINNLGYNF